MQSKTKIFYTGVDIDTLELLIADDEFEIVGVSNIENFFKLSWNFFNYLFIGIYYLQSKNVPFFFQKFFLKIWLVTSKISSPTYRRYTPYLKALILNKIKVYDIDTDEGLKKVAEKKYDVLVVNAWGMLPMFFIESFKKAAINIHPSKLPQYRGALPTLWTLKNNDLESAVTYMLLNNNADCGSIINQHMFSVENTDDWYSIEKKVNSIIKATFIVDIKKYLNGDIKPQSQNEALATNTEKYENYREINPQLETAKDIFNKIGLYPWLDPGTYAYILFQEKKIYIRSSKISQNYIKNFTVFSFKISDNQFISFKLFKDTSIFDSLFLIKKRKLIKSTLEKKNNDTIII